MTTADLPLIAEFETCIRRDPAQRGLIATEPAWGPVCPGHLGQAAAHLAEFGRNVAIVTGFYIPAGDPPAAETDGPPGALALAQALLQLGIESVVLTDALCIGAVRAAALASAFPIERVICYPHPSATDVADAATSRWRADFWRSGPGKNLSHLIAIERVGPSHTLESLARQPRGGAAPARQFAARVPPEQRDCCHNMRGENIDRFAGDVHRLFEECAVDRTDVKTIGIGDGANEIGMGAALWEDLERRLSGEQAGRVPCRIATNWNIVAGTSNWGGYALAAAVALLRGNVQAVAAFDAAHEQRVLNEMVESGPAVDGVTRRREATVDGLPFLTYIQPWEAIRAKLGLRE
ncbi:MAG: DUF4392 domain-containing protein [Planctomycetia bacterium]|nr:DUF4392 domain-containing protein [Planctomycetia bacterium]